MSDTPRTDKLLKEIQDGVTKNGCIPKEFVRQLERELNDRESMLRRITKDWSCDMPTAEFSVEWYDRVNRQLEQEKADLLKENLKLKESFKQSTDARAAWLRDFDRLRAQRNVSARVGLVVGVSVGIGLMVLINLFR